MHSNRETSALHLIGTTDNMMSICSSHEFFFKTSRLGIYFTPESQAEIVL